MGAGAGGPGHSLFEPPRLQLLLGLVRAQAGDANGKVVGQLLQQRGEPLRADAVHIEGAEHRGIQHLSLRRGADYLGLGAVILVCISLIGCEIRHKL